MKSAKVGFVFKIHEPGFEDIFQAVVIADTVLEARDKVCAFYGADYIYQGITTEPKKCYVL